MNLLRRFEADERQRFADEGVAMSLVIPAGPLYVSGLESHCYSILSNLILNARDAVVDPRVPGEREKRIEIAARSEASRAVIEIKDNGIGIDAASLPRIFDAFFSTKPETGTGLGLGTVKKIIQLYDGTIDVDTSAGEGATFTVRLPLADPGLPT